MLYNKKDDDAHFPTGQANGLIPAKYPERARKYVMMQYTDCAGPVVCASLDVNLMMTKQFTLRMVGVTGTQTFRYSQIEVLAQIDAVAKAAAEVAVRSGVAGI